MRKFVKTIFVCLLMVLVSFTIVEAASYKQSVRGWSSTETSRFKLSEGNRYYFTSVGGILIDAKTSGHNVNVATELDWERWYGYNQIKVGNKKYNSLGNNSKSLKREIFSYKFNSYINTTSSDFFLIFGSTNSTNNYYFEATTTRS